MKNEKITTLIILLLCAVSLFAQTPEKFSYQAVVRNANNQLVASATVGVRVSILQGSASGNAVYVETHSANANANGLLTVEIGGGSVQQGVFANIDWANGPYFLKTETDPNGGSSYTVTSTQQLLSVPYALYAKEAGNVPQNVGELTNDAGYLTDYTETDPEFNAWDKDYNDLINTPEIPTIPNNVSTFINDAGYITMDSVPTIPTNVSTFTNDAGYITQADVPGSLDIPTNVSAFVNDAGYITSNDIPDIPAVPTNVSQLNNDAGYITMNSIPTGLAGSNTGDIMYWDAATSTWIMMPAGSSGQVLTVENGVPVWANLPEYATMTLPPTVTTSAPSEVTQSSALCGGVVTNDGNVQLTACGVCWSTHHFPTVADAHTENDLTVSAFTSHIEGLAHNTTYYVRAYASNSVGTTYGAEMTFTTADIPSGSVAMPAPCSADTNTVWHPTLGPGNTLCAGTDSVELTLNNYQYGSIQWQYSTDTVSWFDIPGAIDTLLVYKPEQTQFVRAAVSYANCPTEYSAVKLLQKAPLAYAGISRTVSSGDTVHLQANTEEGATGSWQILQGANGFLTDPTDAASKFYGTDSLYRLRWTLTNSCGVSSDDISVRYVQTVLSDKVVMVDTTDIIFSDSAQMAQGFYIISFSDPNIVIGDSTILVSLINGGFLRRVDSWSMSDDTTYAMYTSQATLYDVLESGVIQIGAISGVNEVDTTDQNEPPVQDVSFLDHIPTRAELRADSAMSRSNRVYIYHMDIEMPDGSRVNLMPNQNAQGGMRGIISHEVEFNQVKWFGYKPNIQDDLSLENVNFTLKAKPTLEYDRDHRCVKFGLYNAQFNMSADLVYTLSTCGELNIVDYNIMKGTVAFIVCDIPFTLDYGINFDINGSLQVTETVRHTFTANATFTKGVRYYCDGNRFELDEHQSGSTDVTVSSNTSGSADLSTSLSAFLNLKLFGLVGPRIKGGYKAKIKYCSSLNTNAPNGWQGKITSDLFVKVDLKGAKVIDIIIPEDWYKEWTFLHKERTYPYTISRFGGNSQIINATGPLASPIKVIVKGSGGKTIRNVPVYFRPKDGGSVSDSLVYTNQQGIAQTLWTPGEICGEHQLHAFVYDCEQHPIEGVPLVFNAYESADCANSTLDLHYNVSGNVVSLVATGGVPPYTYSVDGNNFVSTLPVLSATGNYVLSVKDAHGCSYSITYGNTATSTCDWSNLDLAVETHNGTLSLEATGGTPPYQYSLEGIAYSPTNVFTSLPAGNYTAYVQDAAGCVFSRSISIEEGSSGSSSDYSHPCAGVPTVTDFDGNVYHTVQIGQQCWMKENMRTTHYADGTFIPLGYGRFYPNDNAGNVSQYGCLYNWNVTTRDVYSSTNPSGVQGICPYGWHVPSSAEWGQLISYVSSQPQWRCEGGSNNIAKALASQQGWNISTTLCTPGNESYLNNVTGFTALPAGAWINGFCDFGAISWFWTTSIYNNHYDFAYDRYLKYNIGDFSQDQGHNSVHSTTMRGYSVRCLRD